MSVKLNKRAYEHAQKLIKQKEVALDERDAWSEHQPSAQQQREFIEAHGLDEYGRWFLGVDEDVDEDKKTRYKFPYGDFARLHRCGVLSAEVRAAQYKHHDVEKAVAHLHGMLDELRELEGAQRKG